MVLKGTTSIFFQISFDFVKYILKRKSSQQYLEFQAKVVKLVADPNIYFEIKLFLFVRIPARPINIGQSSFATSKGYV